jgi:hypothetical protein
MIWKKIGNFGLANLLLVHEQAMRTELYIRVHRVENKTLVWLG